MNKTEAINALVEMGVEEFRAKKFVLDVLDYIHDENFPEALIFIGFELLAKIKSDEDNEVDAPLKKIVQDDSSFEFGVADVDINLSPYERMFNSLKPRLNLYRLVKAL